MNGFSRSISGFLRISEDDFLSELNNLIENPSKDQIDAWKDCFRFLKIELSKLPKEKQRATIIFEYKLENGMRPDVLILTRSNLLVLEFKSGESVLNYLKAHLDQVEDYTMRLENYHKVTYSKELNVKRFIVSTHPSITYKNETFLINSNFIEIIEKNIFDYFVKDEIEEWINSSYEAIPNILEAIDYIFNPEELPDIMLTKSNIDNVLSTIKDIESNPDEGLKIVFISGDPGAGKTLVGLKLVRDLTQKQKSNRAAAYLSGNGPLVNVLRYQIDQACSRYSNKRKAYGEAYIKKMQNFLDNYIKYLQIQEVELKPLHQSLIVFDEAQRSWSKKQMKKKKKINYSQPLMLIGNLMESIRPDEKSKTLVCLIGDGQEIYTGEEEGIQNWIDAIERVAKKYAGRIKVYIPPKYKEQFQSVELILNEELHLNTYLRGHRVDDYPEWVKTLLLNDKEETIGYLEKIYSQAKHYPIYLTRSLEEAKSYLDLRFNGQETYGVVCSSFGQYDLEKYQMKGVPDKENGAWYTKECKKFKQYATEFNAQGLEIDFPVIYWGKDLIRKEGNWFKHSTLRRSQEGTFYDGLKEFDDPMKILKNIYRVLLTRGRSGLIICIPDSPELDETYNFFAEEVGVHRLELSLVLNEKVVR